MNEILDSLWNGHVNVNEYTILVLFSAGRKICEKKIHFYTKIKNN